MIFSLSWEENCPGAPPSRNRKGVFVCSFAGLGGGQPRTIGPDHEVPRTTAACARPSRRSCPASLQRRQSTGVRPRIRLHRPALAYQPRPRKGRSLSARALQAGPLEEDAFTANTPIGPVPMRNFIVRFPGKKDGVIVLATTTKPTTGSRTSTSSAPTTAARRPAC